MKVRIKKLPQARTGYQVQGSLANDVPAMGGADYNTYIGKPELRTSKYLTAVPREEANLEAEGGETAYGDLNGDGMAEHKIIKGPRHSNGGVPLKLPDDTFIYSDFRGMSINEPEFLQMFGKVGGSLKSKKKSYTPAELAKQYDIEKYRKILQDPDSDYIDKKTAELMIKNYQTKLGLLAIVQESKKGLPQGEAEAFKPGMAALGMNTDSLTDPGIAAFEKQIQSKIEGLKQQEQQPNEQEGAQEAGSEDGYAEAQEMNQGQPVAQPQEMEQPMAQYGMSMGGYDLPFAQDGIELGPIYTPKSNDKNYDRNQPGMQEYLKTIQRYNEINGKPEFIPVGEGPLNENQMRNYEDLIEEINSKDHGTSYDPETGEPLPNEEHTPEEYLKMYKQNVEDCPCMKKVIVQGMPQNKCVPCEQMAMAQYGMSMGGYDLPYGDDIPEAEYGMAMGVNSRNYMGRPKSPMYARGGALRTYQGDKGSSEVKPGGGAATDLDVSGKSDAEIRRMEWDAKQKDPNANFRLVRKNAKGKTVALKHTDVTDNYQERGKKYGEADFKDKKYKDTPANRIALAQIEMFEQQLNDPKFGAEYVKETQEALKDPRVFKTRNGQLPIYKNAYGKEPTPEEIKTAAVNMFRRNTMLQAQGFNARLLKDSGVGLDDPATIVKDGVINPTNGKPYTLDEAKAAVADYKAKKWTSVAKVVDEFGLPPIGGKADIALEQTTTHGYARLNDKLNSGGYDADPDMKYLMTTTLGENRKGELNSGRGDEKSMQGLYKNSSVQISPSDGYYGNTSAEQKNAADPGSVSYIEEPEAEEKKTTDVNTDTDPECECETADGGKITTEKDANGECLPCPEEEVLQDVPKEPAKFWTQDNIKTAGAFTDLMSINKYGPLSTTADLDKNELEYVDPTRALSANAEQANIAGKALSQIGAPQAASANILASQGKSAANAANIISDYDMKNQAFGSQYATNYANIENQERSYNIGARQKMYDSTMMANQAYDNSKRAARNNLMNAYTNALTNRAKTDAMNQIYPDYQIHPDRAGEMTYKGAGRQMSPGKANEPYWEARQRCVDNNAPDPDKCAENATRQSPTPQNKGEIVNQLYTKAGGFVYSDIVYPFVL